MNTRDLPIGVVYGMPFAEYLMDPGVSNTMLGTMVKSPAHCYALHVAENGWAGSESSAMKLGSMAHCMILEPTKFDERYIVKPDGMNFATKAGKQWRDAVPAGKEIVTADGIAVVRQMRNAIRGVEAIDSLLRVGHAEVSLFWIDQATGLRCKARVDWINTGGSRMALDLKTISDLTTHSVEAAVTRYGYHRQRAHYMNGIRACHINVNDMAFAFVGSQPPVMAGLFLLDDETVVQGHEEVAELLEQFAQCQKSGKWPGPGDTPQITGLSKWARRSQEVEVSFIEDTE